MNELKIMFQKEYSKVILDHLEFIPTYLRPLNITSILIHYKERDFQTYNKVILGIYHSHVNNCHYKYHHSILL